MLKNICRTSNWVRNKTSSTVTLPTSLNEVVNCWKHLGYSTTKANRYILAHPIAQSSLQQTLLRYSSLLHYEFVRTMSSKTPTTEIKSATETTETVEASKFKNRLSGEKSPYLLQHAHNPVDWYPWSEEAIERATRENKLIFLSVGYSTCHWCHVMERESFENPNVAKIMNDNFINIKVDREERPDIDKIYMQFLLLVNGSGGWPMSVWLTPDLAPIVAGTYFPPHDRWGTPSFPKVLQSIISKWRENREQLIATGQEVVRSIQRSQNAKVDENQIRNLKNTTEARLAEAVAIFKQRYDQQYGGFGSKPKFPEVSRLNLLFHAFIATKDADVLDMALETLNSIGNGGIHDHIFGGFARYSVDLKWHIPHFEKMLYDQGQLMSAFVNAYKLTRKEKFLRYANSIFNYIMKDLRHSGGAFYSGEDADSLPIAGADVKVEGAFYAWDWEEVKTAVLEYGTIFEDMEAERVFEIYAYHYDLRPKGNVDAANDPHGHLTEKNILIVRGSEEETCSNFNITFEKLQNILTTINPVLSKIRESRPRLHLDTKIICAWNGLILSGLSKLANCGCEKREEYMQAAKQLVAFARAHLFDGERKCLLRSCYGLGLNNNTIEMGEQINGFLDDYAFLIKGLLDYYKASLDVSALQWAKELQDIQDRLFWDKENGGYFYSQECSPNVIVRLKEDHDGAEPCGNSVAARNLILLGHYYGDESYKQRAEKLFKFFLNIRPFGYVLPEMMSALLLHENGLDIVAVVGATESENTQRLIEICRKFYMPGMVLQHVDPQRPDLSITHRLQENLQMKLKDDKPTVYICHDKVCLIPETDPDKLEASLQENFFRN